MYRESSSNVKKLARIGLRILLEAGILFKNRIPPLLSKADKAPFIELDVVGITGTIGIG